METTQKPKIKKRWVDMYSDDDISLSILRNLPQAKNMFVGEDSHSFRNLSAQNNGDDSYSGFMGRFRGGICDGVTPRRTNNEKVVGGFDRVMLALEGESDSVCESQDRKRHDTYEEADKENTPIKKLKPQVQLSAKSTHATKVSLPSSPVSEMKLSPYIPVGGETHISDVCEWRRREDSDHLHVGVDGDTHTHTHTHTHTERERQLHTRAHTQAHTHAHTQIFPPTHTPAAASSHEQRVNYRKKQIAVGKSSRGYHNYYGLRKPSERNDTEPRTPDPYSDVSKSRFDENYAEWRRQLHRYDTPTQV